ncbi:hypothetical protein [Actinomyces timonensis]|uniref:hypothetical protein n=1 Tax=Actinomyces timonensis TaxID=1288391 RepID=UPI0002F3B6EF|nr:hypothetical protein [Actinomyces timonensis]
MAISFVWSHHGSSRARQRGISDEAISAALNNPALTMPGNGTVTIITCFIKG